MNRLIKRSLDKTMSFIVVIGVMLSLISTVQVSVAAQAKTDNAINDIPYDGHWISFKEEDIVYTAFDEKSPRIIKAGEGFETALEIEKSGEYKIIIEYKSLKDIVLKSTILAEIAEYKIRSQIFSIWKDSTANYLKDSFGNEIPPRQVTEDTTVCDYLKDQADIAIRPYSFKLDEGKTTLKLTSDDVDMALYRVLLVKKDVPVSYGDYISKLSGSAYGSDYIEIEGEKYTVKSDSYIRAFAERNPALTPYDYRSKKLNVLDGGAFGTAGQKVIYNFKVETAGLYHLSVRYSQNFKEGIPAYSNIKIDGKTPFEDMNSVAFKHTGMDYENLTLTGGEGENLSVYLDEGHHSISFEVDGTPLSDIVSRLREILGDLSRIGLEIKKIAGTQSSSHRSWEVESYLPGVIDELKEYERALGELHSRLGSLQMKNPAAGANLKLAGDKLEKFLAVPDKLPGKLNLLNEGSGSCTQLLSDQIDTLTKQNLSIDKIMFHNKNAGLPSARVNIFRRIFDGAKRFVYALFLSEEEKVDDDTLKVWVNRPIYYIETLQSMADTMFTPQSGVKVKFSVMPNEQRIILSNATKTTPDVIMGVGSNVPYDLGIRGAIVDLNEIPDFADYIQKAYNPQSLIPYMDENRIYGVTETQEFYVMMVRRDIFDDLGLEIPNTWGDVAKIMPTLRRSSMDFYLQLSGYSGTKPLYTTVPFILQAGGSLYAENGLTTTISSESSLKGFETLTNLYKIYSLPLNVNSFYNSFRYGQIPIGIGSFTDYVKIKNAAPEIAGLWELVSPPGFEDENGNVIRATTAASTACAIMKQSDKPDESWAFLKWWLSAEVQIEFGNVLQTTYGPDYMWNSANTEAFKELAFPQSDKAVILNQWEQMQEIHRHPALYAVERELSNAWSNVVIGGKSPRIALDDAVLNINREFNRKLEEFNFIEADGSVIKEYKFYDIDDILKGGAR